MFGQKGWQYHPSVHQSSHCSCDKPVCLCGGRMELLSGWANCRIPGGDTWAGDRAPARGGWLWAKAACCFIAWVSGLICLARNSPEEAEVFAFLFLPWGKKPIKDYLWRVGACCSLPNNRVWETNMPSPNETDPQGERWSVSTLNWFEIVFLEFGEFGRIEGEGEGREEASELVGVFCCFLFGSIACGTVLAHLMAYHHC